MDKKDRFFFKELFGNFARKLDENFAILNTKLNNIMTRQADFDAALAKLKPAIDQCASDFAAYKAAAQAQGVDLTAEETTLQTSLDNLGSLHTEISGGTPAQAPSGNPAPTDPSSTPANADTTPATTGS